MLSLTPAITFLKTQPELAAEHSADVRSSKMPVILSFALAAMAGKSNVTNDNLLGARIFIDTLLNLAEKPEVPKLAAPNKDLGMKLPSQEKAKK